MRAKRILQTGAFDPEDVQRLQTAFDLAWADLASHSDANVQETSRELLATIIVAAGNVSGLDAGELASVAVRSFLAIADASRTAS